MRHGNWKLALLYGLIAFGIGFVFGALRELVLIPLVGQAGGHWAEFPLVTGAICTVGYRIGAGMGWRPDTWVAGFGGAALLMAIEAAFAFWVMRQPVDIFLAGFDISKGALFPFGLAAMAVAPRVGWRG